MGLGALTLLILLGVGQAKLGLVCSYETNKQESGFGGFIPGGNGETYPDIIYFERAEWCEPLASSLFSFLPLLLLSLITYKMRDEVFRAWWRFARWFVPVIIVVTLFVQNAGGGGGWGMNGGAFDAFFIGIFYFILILVSLIKIVRAYLKTKEI